MLYKFYMLFFLLYASNIFSQSLVLNYEFGEFNNASGFCYSNAGFFYVTDSHSNEVFKVDTLGNIHKSIGGYGWSASTFDNPICVYTNILNVFVTDYNNNRIQIFDKDLNYITEIVNNDNISFKFPIAAQISKQGDIFILDSDNKRILKLNSNGEFLLSIGDYDAGNFQLDSPTSFCIYNDSFIIVSNKNELFIFDLFGNGISKLKLNFSPKKLNCIFEYLTITDNDKLLIGRFDLNNKIILNENLITFKDVNDIKDALIISTKLFLLRQNLIQVYNLSD